MGPVANVGGQFVTAGGGSGNNDVLNVSGHNDKLNIAAGHSVIADGGGANQHILASGGVGHATPGRATLNASLCVYNSNKSWRFSKPENPGNVPVYAQRSVARLQR